MVMCTNRVGKQAVCLPAVLLIAMCRHALASMYRCQVEPVLEHEAKLENLANVLGGGIPQLLHQSWKTERIPPRFANWPNTWRQQNPEFTWHLWTDQANRFLIRKHYSWFLPTYDALRANVMRADAARLFYMHRYGGVYTDLDNEALRPMADLLGNLSGAVLGRMGHNESFEHSIPNAWMASTPGHPFWIFAAMLVQQRVVTATNSTRAEYLTGPILLHDAHRLWKQLQTSAGAAFPAAPLHILEPGLIYPVDWSTTKGMDECLPDSKHFNTTVCKAHFPQAYVISYCASCIFVGTNVGCDESCSTTQTLSWVSSCAGPLLLST